MTPSFAREMSARLVEVEAENEMLRGFAISNGLAHKAMVRQTIYEYSYYVCCIGPGRTGRHRCSNDSVVA